MHVRMMYICKYVCIFACIHVCMYTCSMYVYVCMYVCTCVRTYCPRAEGVPIRQATHVCVTTIKYTLILIKDNFWLWMYVYIRMYVCVHTYVCMYVCMYACAYDCMYVCMYICMILIFNVDVQVMVSNNLHQWIYHTHLMLSRASLSTCIPMHLLCQLLIRTAAILKYWVMLS